MAAQPRPGGVLEHARTPGQRRIRDPRRCARRTPRPASPAGRSRSPGSPPCRRWAGARPSRRARTSAFVSSPTGNRARRELLRGEVVQKVGLVLGRVAPLPEDGPAAGRVAAGARVVAGRDGLAAHRARAVPERRELDLRVARRARDGCLTRQVRADERAHHVAPELLLEVQDVVADPERPRDPPGVAEIIERAAAPGAAGLGRVVPELHGEADDLVALLLEEERGDRGVDASGHGHGDAHGEKVSAIALSSAVPSISTGKRRAGATSPLISTARRGPLRPSQAGVTISIIVEPPIVNSPWFSSGASVTALSSDEGAVGRVQIEQDEDVLPAHLDRRMLPRDLGVVQGEVHLFAPDHDARLVDRRTSSRRRARRSRRARASGPRAASRRRRSPRMLGRRRACAGRVAPLAPHSRFALGDRRPDRRLRLVARAC